SLTVSASAVSLNFVSVAVGGGPLNGQTCGITSDGDAYCWGSNQYGQLGDGTVSQSKTAPVLVGGGIKWAKLDVGNSHICGVSVAGTAYCWGANFFGTLGDGTS